MAASMDSHSALSRISGSGSSGHGPAGALRIAVDVVGDAVVVDDPPAFLPAAREPGLSHLVERLGQVPPVRAHAPIRGQHLVVVAGIRLVQPLAVELPGRLGSIWFHEQTAPIVYYPDSYILAAPLTSAARNRLPAAADRASGETADSPPAPVAPRGPVVELNVKKRSPRRHSASLAFTGNVS